LPGIIYAPTQRQRNGTKPDGFQKITPIHSIFSLSPLATYCDHNVSHSASRTTLPSLTDHRQPKSRPLQSLFQCSNTCSYFWIIIPHCQHFFTHRFLRPIVSAPNYLALSRLYNFSSLPLRIPSICPRIRPDQSPLRDASVKNILHIISLLTYIEGIGFSKRAHSTDFLYFELIISNL